MLELTNKTKSLIKNFLIVSIIIFGIYLRSVALFQANSIFLDEGLLIINFHEKHYWQMFLPLEHLQAAPPVFLILAKFIYQIFGINEVMLRFLPYIAGNFALIMFYFLAKKIFKTYLAASTALFMFAVNPQVIWMGAYLKPYISDVMCLIIALLIAFNIDLEKITKKQVYILGLSAALGIWCSYTMLFVVAGLSFVYMCKVYLSNDQKLKQLFKIYIIPLVISFLVYFSVNLFWVYINPQFHNFWSSNYSFAIKSIADYKALMAFLFQYSDLKILTPLFILGAFIWFKECRFKFFLLISPLAACFAASYFNIYPFAQRLVLFIIPIMIVLAAKPLDLVAFKRKTYSLIMILSFIFLLFPLCKSFCLEVVKNNISFEFSNTREGYLALKNELKEDEIIYVYFYNFPSFKSYNYKFKIPESNIIYGKWHSKDYDKYLIDLNKLPKKKVIWFVLLNEGFAKNECSVIKNWVIANTKIQSEQIVGKTILIKAYRY